MSATAAQGWFIAGTVPLIVAGGGHALAALRDAARPRVFAPVDGSVKPAMESTTIRLRRRFRGGSGTRPSMWSVWLGINITHGLGIATFGLLCLLIAVQDFDLVQRIDAIRPVAIAFSAALFAVCLRFFFYGPALVTGIPTACFIIATVLSA
jgi:hypothetical protein